MPIHLPFTIRNLTQSEFDEIDRVVIKCAYATQNELGRLCDERVYENDLALRLREAGMIDVHTQIPVTVSFKDFSKVYRLDLLVSNALYELKTVSALTPRHDAQALQYGMLAGINHVKILNFLTSKVQGRLRYNTLNHMERQNVIWNTERWRRLSDRCTDLREHFITLIGDWGSCLEASLYEEALVHHFGGESACTSRVPMSRNGQSLGTHLISSHSEGFAFVITAFMGLDSQRHHLQRLLRLTGLKGLQWLNLSHRVIQLETLIAQ
ncbi:MAG: GxxExxY protein [Verrucomicrobiota bacterium]